MNWRELKASEVTARDESFYISEEEHNEMREYELSIASHDDGSQYGGDDWYESIGHFND